MRQKISALLEKAVRAAHRPSHRAKLELALQRAKDEEAAHERQIELREQQRLRRWRW